MNVIVCSWAEKELIQTIYYENEVKKKSFYFFMVWYTTLWFLALPLIVLVAHFLQSWYRKKVVAGFSFSVITVIFLIVILIFRPTKGNRFFKVLDPNMRVSFATNNMQVFPL
jgi:glucan phosphoethanolaminetransferase (alkaline phosphatase superfamily)